MTLDTRVVGVGGFAVTGAKWSGYLFFRFVRRRKGGTSMGRRRKPKPSQTPDADVPVRFAIYPRNSTSVGLNKDFNTQDAQRGGQTMSRGGVESRLNSTS